MPPRAVLMRNASGFIDASARRVDHPARRRIERHVQRHDVRTLEQCLERHRQHAGLAIEIVVVPDVVRDDARAKRAAEARDLLADVAAADDADGGRGNLPPAGDDASAGGEIARERHHAAAERDHETDRELGDRLPIDAWRPPHRDAVTPRGIEIDHVETDAVLADEAQLRQRAQTRASSSTSRPVIARLCPRRNSHERVAGQDRRPRVVEARARISLEQLLPEDRVSRERSGGDGDGIRVGGHGFG